MDIVSFFTTIPCKGDIERIPKQLWALPLLSVITSFVPTIAIVSDIPFKNVFALISLYAVVGLIHLDGLADFSDGLMVKGSVEEKLRAMKDVNVGIAGTFSVVVILLIQAIALERSPPYSVFLSELNSKYAMLISLGMKRPLGDGLAKFFMERMDFRQIAVGTCLYITLIFVAYKVYPTSVLTTSSLIPGLLTALVALKTFKGLNGDCIGAVAEITRASSLVISCLR